MRWIVLILWMGLEAGAVLAQRPFRERRDAMGTTATVLVYAQSREAASPLLEAAFEEIVRVEQLLSDYLPSSELSRINSANGQATLDPEMLRILNRALGWARDSGGAFDPTAGPLVDAWGFSGDSIPTFPGPEALENARARVGWTGVQLDLSERTIEFDRPGMRLDPGAFGKGYALESAAAVLRDLGVSSALLSMGGSSYRALGAPPGQQGWLIHIDDPTQGGALTTSVFLVNGALSTSGAANKNFEVDGMLYGHILDPRSGLPARGSAQVTVLAPDAMDADALSTALFVLGPDASGSFLQRVPEAAAWILYDSPQGPAVRTIRWPTTEDGP